MFAPIDKVCVWGLSGHFGPALLWTIFLLNLTYCICISSLHGTLILVTFYLAEQLQACCRNSAALSVHLSATMWISMCPPFFGGGELGPHVTQCGLAEAYYRTKWHLDPSSRLATTNIGHKLRGGGCAPFWRRAGSPSSAMLPEPTARGLPARQVSSWSIQPFDHNTPTLYRQ